MCIVLVAMDSLNIGRCELVDAWISRDHQGVTDVSSDTEQLEFRKGVEKKFTRHAHCKPSGVYFPPCSLYALFYGIAANIP